MDNVSRSYLITGFAAISAGAIALTPVQPVPDHMALAQRAASTLGVELAATIDPIQPWVDLIQATVANTATITQQVFNPGPGLPILNALGSNLGVYLGELPNIGAIVNEILGNVKAGIAAPLDQNLDDNPLGGGPDVSWNTNNTTVVTCLFATNCGANGFTKFQTTGLLVNTPGFDELGPLINVLSSPLSGALVGFLSPGLSAFAQVIDSVNVVTTAVTTGNWAKALNEVINLPANLLNAYLNGGKQLDLTQIVERVAPVLGLNIPAGTKLGLATGGLLSPGVALGGGSFDPPANTRSVPFGGWAGTAWDSVSAEADLSGIPVFVKGLPLGQIATMLGMRTTIANAIRLPVPVPAQATSAQATAALAAAEPAPQAAAAVAADLAPAPKWTARSARGAGSDNAGRSVAEVVSGTPAPAAAVADLAPAPKGTAPAARSASSDKAGHPGRGARSARNAG
jgi:hypothetical protein